MLDGGTRFNPEFPSAEEGEEVDVEEVVADMQEKYDQFMTPKNEDKFDQIFDAARKSYENSEVRKDWDQLFEELESGLGAAVDDEETDSVLQTYVKKADALAK